MNRTALSRFLADYGMLFVLLLLCAWYSLATVEEQPPPGATAGQKLADQIISRFGQAARVLVVTRDSNEEAAFADQARTRLSAAGLNVAGVVKGQPADARQALEQIAAGGAKLDVIACTQATAAWELFDTLGGKFPALASAKLVTPRSYKWPNFLKADNLLNVANQIAVIAIIAAGMTMVIITGGIDLSVGSLIALSAVVTTLLIRGPGGGEHASTLAMTLAFPAGIVFCGSVGLFSGFLATMFRIPSFMGPLALLLVPNRRAYLAARRSTIPPLAV